ncbi:hypothetical protein D0Z00_001301 [Geotrichum galactomycetum]|uniref:Uncharacterized protein n=1 Tax=Geotrichum galactomycetum TaxID=27317 RepID=A0ACB6V794_9ASCO|nr:hypothetical protein D0Z00_001301 [Geotrichum candidum]
MSHKAANPTPASSSKSSPPTLLDSPVTIDQDRLRPVGSRSHPIELSEEENNLEEDEEIENYNQYTDDDVNDFDDDFDDFDEDASMDAEEEEEEDDDYYEFLDKLKNPKIYETEFEVLSPNDLHKMEKDTISHVSGFLSVTEAQARALLWTYKWQADPLIEAYVDNPTKILEKSGLLVDKTTGNPISIAPYSVSTAPPGYFCFICCEEPVADKPFYTFEIDCRHSLCVDCYKNYLRGKIVENETFEEMQEKMKELQETAGMSWIEVQFLSQAFEVLSASRHTMTWTYAFAYYLQKTHRTVIFEDNQNDLEVAVEQLSELFERPAMDLASLKINLLDKCQYVASRRVVLLEDVAQGLLDDAWKYNVSF